MPGERLATAGRRPVGALSPEVACPAMGGQGGSRAGAEPAPGTPGAACPGRVWAERPCQLCGRPFAVIRQRAAGARFCSRAHRLEWSERQREVVTLRCGHALRLPKWQAATRRYCSWACFRALVPAPPPPAAGRALGPRAKHARAVAAYRAAVETGAGATREIAAAAGLSPDTVRVLRRELGAAPGPAPRRYRVVLTPAADGEAWGAAVPALPGCRARGATPEEALARVQAAIGPHLEALRAAGGPIRAGPRGPGGVLEV